VTLRLLALHATGTTRPPRQVVKKNLTYIWSDVHFHVFLPARLSFWRLKIQGFFKWSKRFYGNVGWNITYSVPSDTRHKLPFSHCTVRMRIGLCEWYVFFGTDSKFITKNWFLGTSWWRGLEQCGHGRVLNCLSFWFFLYVQYVFSPPRVPSYWNFVTALLIIIIFLTLFSRWVQNSVKMFDQSHYA